MSLNSVKRTSRWSRRSKESLAAQKIFVLGELRLEARLLDILCLDGQRPQLGDLPAYHLGVPGQCDRVEQPLEPLAVALLHLVELGHARQVRRCGAREVLGLRETAMLAKSIPPWSRDAPRAGRPVRLRGDGTRTVHPVGWPARPRG